MDIHRKSILSYWIVGIIVILGTLYIGTEWLWVATLKDRSAQIRTEVTTALGNDLVEGNIFRFSSTLSQLRQNGSIVGADIRTFSRSTAAPTELYKTFDEAPEQFFTSLKSNASDCSYTFVTATWGGVIESEGPMTVQGKSDACYILRIKTTAPNDLKTLKNRFLMLFGLIVVFISGFLLLFTRWWQQKIDKLEYQSHIDQLNAAVELGKFAAQVAHDIKSPLSALDLVVNDLTGLPEAKRTLVRSAVNRIKDIANSLLEKNREIIQGKAVVSTSTNQTQSLSTNEPKSIQLLSSIIEGIMTEKRMQFSAKPGIEINYQPNDSSYGLFADIQPTEFKRMISNLCNNAIEVLGEKGKVDLLLEQTDSAIQIIIRDNGKGIPPEILKKLGQRGETHGKLGGSGLGLFHARSTIESWAGSLKIESEVGKGTDVIISLPKVKPPSWFVPELKVAQGATVVVMDDDNSIKEIWRQRLEEINAQNYFIEIIYFSNPDELEKWFNQDNKHKTALFLLDFEIIGNKRTGLDIAELLNLGLQSILVTSRWEELQIQNRCARSKIRLIPKGLAGFVPMKIQKPLEKFDAVLIDNDDLVHMTWRSVANQYGKKLALFTEPKSFFLAIEGIDRSVPIYVDLSLNDGVNGLDLIPKIQELGFRKIYLSTGYEPDKFAGTPGVTAVVGKNAPKEIGGIEEI